MKPEGADELQTPVRAHVFLVDIILTLIREQSVRVFMAPK